MRTAILSFFITVFISANAWAAPDEEDVVAPDADSAAKGKSDGGTTMYDFDDDNVDGEILSPNGANISARGRVKHASLITIRPHFLPELIGLALDV